jgi:hypothetical protein
MMPLRSLTFFRLVLSVKFVLSMMSLGFVLFSISACNSAAKQLEVNRQSSLTGSEFYKQAAAMSWKERDSFALQQFRVGNVPAFWLKLEAVHTSYKDSSTGKTYNAVYNVTPDYFCIGTNDEWARVPLTPMTAKIIADSLECFLPSRKMVDDIYKAAAVKLEPVPMYAFRDSTPTMWHHHLIIEGQRKGRTGLVAGIKKDVVNTSKLLTYVKRDRVAIYGWHKTDGKAIQPLYTGHVDWYVDYSHGIRLVSRQVRVDGKWMDYTEVLKDPVLRHLLCDEDDCNW